MNIKRQATIIYSQNYEATKHFYEKVLEFSVEMDFSSVIFYKEGIAVWKVGEDHNLRSILGPNFEDHKSHPFELYFEIGNWDETIERLKKFDINYLHDVHEEPWGQRTIRILDPEQNIVEFGETLESFIKRLFDKGTSLEEIASMNGLSLEDVQGILKN